MTDAHTSGSEVRDGIYRDYEMEFKDVNIKCVTCGREFIFTAREQEFFFSKGFKEPRHCRECRQRRKQDRERIFAEASGQEYQPGKESFKVVCAQCQRETTVPFKPITGKPVLCKDCFIAQRYGSKKEEEKPAPEEPAVTEVPPTEEKRPTAASEAIPQPGPEIDLEAERETPEKAEFPDEQAPPPAEADESAESSAHEEKEKVKESAEEPDQEQAEESSPQPQEKSAKNGSSDTETTTPEEEKEL